MRPLRVSFEYVGPRYDSIAHSRCAIESLRPTWCVRKAAAIGPLCGPTVLKCSYNAAFFTDKRPCEAAVSVHFLQISALRYL